MKNYRFYLEFPDEASKRRANKRNGYKGHSGNVFAANLVKYERTWRPVWIPGTMSCEGMAAVSTTPNSPVECASASWDYLRLRCTRISEELAREIHPALFSRID